MPADEIRQSVESPLTEKIAQATMDVEKRVSRKSHAPIGTVQAVVFAQGQIQLVSDIRIEVVGIIVDNIVNYIDSFRFFQITNYRQRSTQHGQARLRSVFSRNVLTFFF